MVVGIDVLEEEFYRFLEDFHIFQPIYDIFKVFNIYIIQLIKNSL